MSQDLTRLMQTCVDNVEIKKYITHFGVKLHRMYPVLYGIEDGIDELWFGVFRAITKRYKAQIPLILFAKRAVFSRYGSLIKVSHNMGKLLNEYAYCEDIVFQARRHDRAYNAVDVSFTLDQIARDLETRASKSRQYKFTVAVNLFGLLRKGYTVRLSCTELNISHTQGYRLYNEIICGCGNKYRSRANALYRSEHDETITTDYSGSVIDFR